MGNPKYDRWQLHQVLMLLWCIIYILARRRCCELDTTLVPFFFHPSHCCDVILIRSKIPVLKYAM